MSWWHSVTWQLTDKRLNVAVTSVKWHVIKCCSIKCRVIKCRAIECRVIKRHVIKCSIKCRVIKPHAIKWRGMTESQRIIGFFCECAFNKNNAISSHRKIMASCTIRLSPENVTHQMICFGLDILLKPRKKNESWIILVICIRGRHFVKQFTAQPPCSSVMATRWHPSKLETLSKSPKQPRHP